MRPTPSLMLMAAGFGTRMGALTASRPKPLIEVGGRPLLDHALAVARDAGAKTIVANTHYLGDQIAVHLAGQKVAISHEDGQILETGGGLRRALPLLSSNPVLILNTDAVWIGPNPLVALQQAWDPDRMDGLLLMLPGAAVGRVAADFIMDADGRLHRARGGPGHVYLGAQMLRTDDLAAVPREVFSLNVVWDLMIARGRLFGIVHQGGWCDVGTPEGIAVAEAMLAGSPDA